MEKKVWYIPPKREQKQKTAGIYCRVSSNKRDQLNSLTAQISALVKTVSDAQWSLEEVFIDIASPADGTLRIVRSSSGCSMIVDKRRSISFW